MRHVDALVIGAGVAGTTAALELARSGLDVILVDRAKLPRHKVCGCCLNTEAARMLIDLGLGPRLAQAGATPTESILLSSRGRSVHLPTAGGLSLSRYALDTLLLDAAEHAGCEVLDGTTARIGAIPCQPSEPVSVDCTTTTPQACERFYAKAVIVADGLAGTAAASTVSAKRRTARGSLRGYGAHIPAGQHGLPAGQIIMRCGRGGYIGTVVLEDGSLNIAAAMHPRWVKVSRGPGHAAHRLAEQSGHGLQGVDDLRWSATAPLTGERACPWMQRTFFLGDAAGYIEPFTGEGMAWAMRSALTVLPFAITAVKSWDEQIGLDWASAYRQEVQHRQWRCRVLSSWLRQPKLVSTSLATASLLPTSLGRLAARAIMPAMFQPTSPVHHAEFAAA